MGSTPRARPCALAGRGNAGRWTRAQEWGYALGSVLSRRAPDAENYRKWAFMSPSLPAKPALGPERRKRGVRTNGDMGPSSNAAGAAGRSRCARGTGGSAGEAAVRGGAAVRGAVGVAVLRRPPRGDVRAHPPGGPALQHAGADPPLRQERHQG